MTLIFFVFHHKKISENEYTYRGSIVVLRTYTYHDLVFCVRMETIREYYGLRFDCVVPGVVLEEGMPLCTKASGTGLLDFISSYKDKHSGSNATIGYLDLISLDLTEKVSSMAVA